MPGQIRKQRKHSLSPPMSWSLSEQPPQSSKSKSIDQIAPERPARASLSGAAYQPGRTARDLALTRQTVIDEDAGQLVADRAGGPVVLRWSRLSEQIFRFDKW